MFQHDGDTISGTVVAEPKGQTQEERENNQRALSTLAIEINDKRLELFPPTPEKERDLPPIQTMFYLSAEDQKKLDTKIALKDKQGTEIARAWLPD